MGCGWPRLPPLSEQSWAIVPILEPAKLFRDELFGIERHRITWAACPLRNRIQEGDGSFIGDENVEPPSAVGIGFQTVPEMMAVVGQFTAKLIAANVCRPSFGSSRLCRPPPIIRRGLKVIRRRNSDGSEIG